MLTTGICFGLLHPVSQREVVNSAFVGRKMIDDICWLNILHLLQLLFQFLVLARSNIKVLEIHCPMQWWSVHHHLYFKETVFPGSLCFVVGKLLIQPLLIYSWVLMSLSHFYRNLIVN